MTTATTGDLDLIVECWKSDPSLREDGVALYHFLRSAEILLGVDEVLLGRNAEHAGAAADGSGPKDDGTSGLGAERACREILKGIVQLLEAERVFLFELKPRSKPDDSILGAAIASCDVDGEPVHDPARKAPLPLLEQAGRDGQPVLGPVSTGGEGSPPDARGACAESGQLALPLRWGGERLALLLVENRFRPLAIGREAIRTTVALGRLLGTILSWSSLRRENVDLWEDVRRLRRETAAAKESVPTAACRGASHRGPRRADIKGDYAGIIGSSPCMLEIFQVVDRISSSNVPVLINGESGTGKELIAQAVHRNSPRQGKVFVSENCGALTETLLESELFGYVKGAFTGATKDQKGLFELAEGGTLFLDEVGDMSPGMQKKLLRVLQEGVIRRVGGKEYIPVNVRLISATNKDLLEEVRSGNFREDLYFRLNVINLRLPPLRERREDIPEMVSAFLAEMEKEAGVSKRIEPPAVQRLMKYGWPGNVRELRNEVKRVFALSEGDIMVHDLSETIISGDAADTTFHSLGQEIFHLTLKEATERLEKAMIRNSIIQSRGNKSLVAKMLQVPKTSLYNKIAKYGLDKA